MQVAVIVIIGEVAAVRLEPNLLLWECLCTVSQRNAIDAPLSNPSGSLRNEQEADALTNGHHSMRLECWSCSPVRRSKGCGRARPAPNPSAGHCGHAYCALLAPDPAGWGETSDSGQGTCSQPTGKGTNETEGPRRARSLEDAETDPDDTSAFDYSSVTSCSPDGTLRREMDSNSGEDEEDSQVPVLLKPSYNQQQQQSRDAARERTVCLRWQIPRLTPHPPLRNTAGVCVNEPAPRLGGSFGKRLVSVRTGSPPLHPNSAFRPIWDDPTRQVLCDQSLAGNRLRFLSIYTLTSASWTRPTPLQRRTTDKVLYPFKLQPGRAFRASTRAERTRGSTMMKLHLDTQSPSLH